MILIGGENLIDYIQEPGADGYPLYRAVPGGSPYNTAKAAARQDAPVGYLTPFSSDSLGTLLRDELAKEPLTILSETSKKPTTLAVVSLDDGQATYQFYRQGTAERDIDLQRLRALVPDDTTAFYVGSLAITDGKDAEIWSELYTEMGANGIFCAIDPNIRADFISDRDAFLRRLNTLMATANLIKLSDQDLEWIAPGSDQKTAISTIFDHSTADLVVLTLGEKGAFAMSHAGPIDIPPVKVPNLADTVGAGDTFMGSLLAQTHNRGLMKKDALKTCGRAQLEDLLNFAAKAAAINCTRVGCNPPKTAEIV